MSRPHANDVVRLAYSQVGYKTTGKKNKYGAWIFTHYPNFYNGNKSYCDWCDVFVDFCVLYIARNAKDAEYVLCQPNKSCGAGCKWSYSYYKKHHRNNSIPHYGDQIFLNTKKGKCAHTGIVYKVTDTHVYYVAGNESNSVKKHKIARNSKSIYAFGVPRYA